jgi:serine/threonine protein kinase
MHTDESELARYEVTGVLGEGADYQVFASKHPHTGADVVLKRPHPTLVAGNQHQAVESRTRDLADLKQGFGDELPHVPKLVGVSQRANHDSLFGDSLGYDYTVTVESRATGVPLVGAVFDGIRKHPIGLPVSIFCIHPLQDGEIRETPILVDILETVESFYKMGYLLMDVRPQNVFYSPKTGDISIIDVCDFRKPREATQRHPPLDMNDMLLDLFRWYVPAGDPPLEFDSWTQYIEPPRSARLERAAEDTKRIFLREERTEDRGLAIRVLERIKARGYSRVSEFRDEVVEVLELRRVRLASSPTFESHISLWKQGLAMMHDDYWSKYLFSADSDLTAYGSAPS